MPVVPQLECDLMSSRLGVSSRLVCQPCFICQLLHHCVNASLLLYTAMSITKQRNSIASDDDDDDI
jgi:hypothetical protein